MIVICKQTGRELEVFYIEVPVFLLPEAEKVLKRYLKDSDEKYEAVDGSRFNADIQLRVIATRNHRNKIIFKLLKNECLTSYSEF